MLTVCLCGSARFERGFKEAMKELGLRGFTVIGLTSYPSENEGEKTWYDEAQKEVLDLVHFNKILMADAVVVIDANQIPAIGSYIGFSTAREIVWASMQGKICVPLTAVISWDELAEALRSVGSGGEVTINLAEAINELGQVIARK